MSTRLLHRVVAGALAATLAFASPVLARGGGGGMGGGGMGGGGMRGTMGGGGMHSMGTVGMAGGMHAMGGPMHVGGAPAHFAAMGVAPHFSGGHFAGTHAAFSPRFGFHRPFFFHHHHFHRFAFFGFGAPFLYAGYDSCWRRVWTDYGLQWVNVCGDYY